MFFSNLIMNKNIKFTVIIHNVKQSFHQYGFTDKQIEDCKSNYNGKDENRVHPLYDYLISLVD
jgi:hypothetical protein